MHNALKLFTPQYLLVFLLLTLASGCTQISNSNLIAASKEENPYVRLLNGNERFSHLKATHPHEDLQRLKELSDEQHPFAVVVCCSDSRVSPEIIFDQGMGDLFVIRTAGNIIGSIEMGSIEYAVEHLGVKLVLLMGHEKCGAVKAFVAGGETPGHIKDFIDSLKNEAEIIAIPASDKNRLDDCVTANVLHGIKQLHTQSNILAEKIEKNELEIRGVRYDLDDFKIVAVKQ